MCLTEGAFEKVMEYVLRIWHPFPFLINRIMPVLTVQLRRPMIEKKVCFGVLSCFCSLLTLGTEGLQLKRGKTKNG